MNSPTEKIAVRFIGRKAPWKDNLYGTNLTFTAGQVRDVPAHYAKQFLKHGDCFEMVESVSASVNEKTERSDEQVELVDDTGAVLEQAEQEKAKQEEEQSLIEDVRQRVMLCESKDELIEMARTKWNQRLNKQKSVETLRTEVVGFIDRFGTV